MLHVAASVLGSRVIRQAACAYGRAARIPYGRIPRPTPAGHGLRRAARLLSAAAFTTHDPGLAQVGLIMRLAALADAVTALRQAQRHAAQAAAARQAAEDLHTAARQAVRQHPANRDQATAATTLTPAAFPATLHPARPSDAAAGGHRGRRASRQPPHGPTPRRPPGPAR